MGCRSTTTYRVGQGGPSRGRPGRNPTRPWRWIASSGTLPATAIPTSLTPVSQGAAHVVVLSLCEAAKREFGGFVQRVFRGFTSTIKLGVFEHPRDAASRERSESARHLDLSHRAYRAPMREVDLSVSRRALGARNVCSRRQYRLSDMNYRRHWRGGARGEV